MNFFLPIATSLLLTGAAPIALPDTADALKESAPPLETATVNTPSQATSGAPIDDISSSENTTASSDVALAESAQLAAAGAVELALQVLGNTQPDYATDPEGWRRFEAARVEILRSGARWDVLAAHLDNLPENLSLADHRWAKTQRASALLALGEGEAALDELRALMWSAEPKSEQELQHWRRLSIRAWEAMDELEAARVAIQRFQQDYADDSRDWQIARARLALRVMAPEEASALLNGLEGTEVEILQLIAGLWSGAMKPAVVVDRAVKLGVSKDVEPAYRREAWAVAAEAAAMLNSREAHIAALERGLVIAQTPDAAPIVPVTADALWDAYLALGEQLGNQMQLIVGDDEAWFLAASNRYDEQPIHARALFAVVALKAYRAEQADVAHWQLAALIDKIPHGGDLMRALYLESDRFETEADIPPAVRYLLLEHVLNAGDIPQASRLLVGLDDPPQQTDPGEWHLRRARVLLLGGRIDDGIAALDQLFRTVEDFKRDRALQVVFDLQTLGRHEAALDFLARLHAGETDTQHARELWYWRADSLTALERYAEAARAYLKSALLLDPYAADPWAQTARFQAAEALTQAGLFADAQRQYRTLLNSTRDAARQAVLRNHLQQLRLLEQRGVVATN
ncbi:MAG TPA: tetratricopeptide repeat protein [Gammaproteobacteria bacterium]